MLPYLTRQLGISGFGELSYYLVIFSFSYVFILISQDGALGRYFFRYGQRAIYSIINAGHIYSIFTSTIAIITLYLLDLDKYITTILYALTQCFIATQLSLKQCRKEAIKYTVLQSLVSFLSSLITIIAFEYIDASVSTRINCLLLGNIIALLIFCQFTLYPINKILTLFSTSWLHIKYVLCFGLPLIIHQLSFWGKGQFDRFLIVKEFSRSELGLYSASFQVSSIIIIVLYAINKAIVPILYQKIKKREIGHLEIMKFVIGSIVLVPIPSTIAFLIPETFYIFLLGDEFKGSKYYVVIFTLGLMMHLPYQFLANYFFYYGRNSLVAFTTFISVIIHIIIVIFMANIRRLDLIPYAILLSNTFVVLVLSIIITNLRESQRIKDTQ